MFCRLKGLNHPNSP